MNVLLLPGCTPTPLAHYLKALGVLRLVAEQADPNITGYWSGNTFHIRTVLDRAALLDFFLHRYEPTPILAPWNGGSGFYPKDNRKYIEALCESSIPRLAPLREALTAAQRLLHERDLKEKPTSPKQKADLLLICRNCLPERTLAWLDASYVLTQEDPAFPPILGKGGIDGNVDFSNRFHQHLLNLIDIRTGAPTRCAASWLALALFGENCDGLIPNPIDQFAPAATGGANSGNGFSASGNINPWDFVLLLEGAALYANAAVRRLQTVQREQPAFPFCVFTTASGYASDSTTDERTNNGKTYELWLPLWAAPAGNREIRALLGEGRVTVGPRPARDGFEFARAVISLGVDRGIESFQRYGIFQRHGEKCFAIPLHRVVVRRDTEASDLLDDLDREGRGWLSALRSALRNAASRDRVPLRITAAFRNLERALFALCTRQHAGDDSTGAIRSVFLAIGVCEESFSRGSHWRETHNTKNPNSRLVPLRLRDSRWLDAARSSAPVETALAVALASLSGFRTHLEAVDDKYLKWIEKSNNVVWQPGPSRLASSLSAILVRRLLLTEYAPSRKTMDAKTVPAPLAAVTDFIEGHTDDALLERLIWSTACVDRDTLRSWAPGDFLHPKGTEPSALFALLRLALAGELPDGTVVPPLPEIARLAAAGNGTTASRLAVRRLRASGVRLGLREVLTAQDSSSVRRLAAALLFPLSRNDLQVLLQQIQPVVLAR